MRALAKDPENRYQTASEFVADLERAIAGEHVERISSELVMAPGITRTITGSSTREQAGEQATQVTLAPKTRPNEVGAWRGSLY